MSASGIKTRRMRLDFLCVGAQKAGTTSLNAYLRQHEQLVVPDHELHFFDDESLDWSQPPVDAYHERVRQPDTRRPGCPRSSLGTRAASPPLHGEVTPIYIYWQPCAERIHRYNPAVKLIVLLRNPLARAFSHWAMEYQRGLDDLPFSEAIRQEPLRCQTGPDAQHRVYSYLDRGRYAVQLRRLFRLFPRRQILILRSEELFHAPEAALLRITDFLGISPLKQLEPTHARQGVYPQSLGREDWEFMARHLEQDIAELEDLLGWNCEDWRQPWIPLV